MITFILLCCLHDYGLKNPPRAGGVFPFIFNDCPKSLAFRSDPTGGKAPRGAKTAATNLADQSQSGDHLRPVPYSDGSEPDLL